MATDSEEVNSYPGPGGGRAPTAVDVEAVMAGLRASRLDWPEPLHLAVVDSTNRRAERLAAAGAPDWTVVVADEQTTGHGRLGRRWEAPPGTALLASVVLRLPPGTAAEHVGWVPLLIGMAATGAVGAAGVGARLKWPNDVVVPAPGMGQLQKLGGVLTEAHLDGRCVLIGGIGINTTMSRAELPVPEATSLRLCGASDESAGNLLVGVMVRLRRLWERWNEARGDADRSGIRPEYEAMCATIGEEVVLSLPGGKRVHGTALGVDHEGHLRVECRQEVVTVTAGDVVHVRH